MAKNIDTFKVVLISSLLLLSTLPSISSQCTNLQFTCDDGECIRLNWICDGGMDCTDGSDESTALCTTTMTTAETTFPGTSTVTSHAPLQLCCKDRLGVPGLCDCSRYDLTEVPASGPFLQNQWIQVLSLARNFIPVIGLSSFPVQLIGLVTLDLSKNNIATIEDGSFRQIAKSSTLKNLDLSGNLLSELSTGLLDGLSCLSSLSLSSNFIVKIDSDWWGSSLHSTSLGFSNNVPSSVTCTIVSPGENCTANSPTCSCSPGYESSGQGCQKQSTTITTQAPMQCIRGSGGIPSGLQCGSREVHTIPFAQGGGRCTCDNICTRPGNTCCPGFYDNCDGTCKALGGGPPNCMSPIAQTDFVSGGRCFCEPACRDQNDCCPDFEDLCSTSTTASSTTTTTVTKTSMTTTRITTTTTVPSCAGQCGSTVGFFFAKYNKRCFCDNRCQRSLDSIHPCCPDYDDFCIIVPRLPSCQAVTYDQCVNGVAPDGNNCATCGDKRYASIVDLRREVVGLCFCDDACEEVEGAPSFSDSNSEWWKSYHNKCCPGYSDVCYSTSPTTTPTSTDTSSITTTVTTTLTSTGTHTVTSTHTSTMTSTVTTTATSTETSTPTTTMTNTATTMTSTETSTATTTPTSPPISSRVSAWLYFDCLPTCVTTVTMEAALRRGIFESVSELLPGSIPNVLVTLPTKCGGIFFDITTRDRDTARFLRRAIMSDSVLISYGPNCVTKNGNLVLDGLETSTVTTTPTSTVTTTTDTSKTSVTSVTKTSNTITSLTTLSKTITTDSSTFISTNTSTTTALTVTVIEGLDLCNEVTCSIYCSGECGWDSNQNLCVTGAFTSEEERMQTLGDCVDALDPIDTNPGTNDVNRQSGSDEDFNPRLIIIIAVVVSVIILCVLGLLYWRQYQRVQVFAMTPPPGDPSLYHRDFTINTSTTDTLATRL
eukprot:m.335503 g.335503  ORF g.335503 m.335503 type:complete len:936 (+) comp17616_c0_seq1:105-2912(+)